MKYGLMGATLLGCIRMEKRMVLANLNGQMELALKEIGNSIKCMGREFLNGLMEENIMVNMKMIKSMEMGCLSGLMVRNKRDIGFKEKFNLKNNNKTINYTLTQTIPIDIYHNETN